MAIDSLHCWRLSFGAIAWHVQVNGDHLIGYYSTQGLVIPVHHIRTRTMVVLARDELYIQLGREACARERVPLWELALFATSCIAKPTLSAQP